MRTLEVKNDSLSEMEKHESMEHGVDGMKTRCPSTDIKNKENDEIIITDCLGERYMGCAKKNGILRIKGTPGNALASYLDGGTVLVDGNAQDAAADTMNAGLLAVRGSAGDALAYGMRGGRVYILGDAGYRAGVHMKAYGDKKSILVIGGRAGSFLGEYLAGGIIIVLGLGYEGKDITGYFCGNGMYAGTIYLRTDKTPLNLSQNLIKRDVDKEEKEKILSPILSDYAETFSLSLERCLSGIFIAIEADKSKTYGELYAAV